ncbi:endonuclease V [candidate division GN15 bacterium]|nr:endonuclease V [candidate division GN15 bacterium]
MALTGAGGACVEEIPEHPPSGSTIPPSLSSVGRSPAGLARLGEPAEELFTASEHRAFWRENRQGTPPLEWKQAHLWPSTKAEAYDLESERVPLLSPQPPDRGPQRLVAVEAAYGHAAQRIYAVAAVLTFPELNEIERAWHSLPVTFPYVPGLFYYREGPVIVEVLRKLNADSDVILVSGHGIAHPRRIGLAAQVGISFDKPSIGCARRLLIGRHRPVGETQGSSQPIFHRGEEIGLAYRSKDRVKPIFISPGNRCSLAYARDVTVNCLGGYRLPEPLRLVHNLANARKRQEEKSNGRDTDRQQESQ